MCNLLKWTYSRCNHPDRDGRVNHKRAAGYRTSELGFIRYCDSALENSKYNGGKTELCNGQKSEDMIAMVDFLKGKCPSCANNDKIAAKRRIEKWGTDVSLGEDLDLTSG
jgi:hypothetical protein